MTSTSAEYCFSLPIIDFVDFYKTLDEEFKRLNKMRKKG